MTGRQAGHLSPPQGGLKGDAIVMADASGSSDSEPIASSTGGGQHLLAHTGAAPPSPLDPGIRSSRQGGWDV